MAWKMVYLYSPSDSMWPCQKPLFPAGQCMDLEQALVFLIVPALFELHPVLYAYIFARFMLDSNYVLESASRLFGYSLVLAL